MLCRGCVCCVEGMLCVYCVEAGADSGGVFGV